MQAAHTTAAAPSKGKAEQKSRLVSLEVGEIEPTGLVSCSAGNLCAPTNSNPGALGEVGVDSRTNEHCMTCKSIEA